MRLREPAALCASGGGDDLRLRSRLDILAAIEVQAGVALISPLHALPGFAMATSDCGRTVA
jgi:hypothetical protein